jgi:hypothetical protein
MVAILAVKLMNDTAILSQNGMIGNYLPLAIVIIGGFLTYFFTTTIEKQKQEYELKKQVYFDTLDTIISTRRLFNKRDKIIFKLQEEEKEKALMISLITGSSRGAYNAILEEIEDNMKSLALQRAKIGICSNQKIKNLVNKIVDNIYNNQGTL